MSVVPVHGRGDRHHGGRDVRRVLRRRLLGARPRLRADGALRPQLPHPRGPDRQHRHALRLRGHQARQSPLHRDAEGKLPACHAAEPGEHGAVRGDAAGCGRGAAGRGLDRGHAASQAAEPGRGAGLHRARHGGHRQPRVPGGRQVPPGERHDRQPSPQCLQVL